MHKRAGAAAAITTVLVLAPGSIIASAAPPGPDDRPAATRATSAVVTLITGDRVTLTERDGASTVAIEPAQRADGRPVAFQRYGDGEHLYVVPSDVARLVPDRLDPRLFDVAGLVAAGYDDANRGTIPIIVQAGPPSPPSAARTLAGTVEPDWEALGLDPERELESIGAVAGEVPASGATELLEALAAPTPVPTTRRAAGAGGAAVAKVWLDGRVEASDADSMPQIGAPEAWDAGYTGEGVTVAVLDTGIDATHPDLDEAVVATANFTYEEDVVDGHGHGTHVASIIAGSGELSDGVNRGVAPDADLMIGKVLDSGGWGEDSDVIEAMEWAASGGADIVNMSLGNSQYTDGADPMSLALDALSGEHGTLFVVAAGNDGGYGTIGSPGAASSALTVGAVDDFDQVTWFSSRGPRDDLAIKPDLTAPGEEIIAAQADGTQLGEQAGEGYVAASGTSMAAPHVAGAAAVLAQQRPTLDGTALKSVLVGSAQPTGGTVWDEGAGRVFLPTALGLEVTAEPVSLSFGTFAYPHDDLEPDTREITYRNPTASDVTLDLALEATDPEGSPVPDGAVQLGAETVTVPAGGTAKVSVTVDPTSGTLGRYSGAVTATGGDGTTVRTAVGWYKEPEMVNLTLEAIGLDGEPHAGDGFFIVMNVDDPDAFIDDVAVTDGETRLRVPPGTYSITGFLAGLDSEGWWTEVAGVLEPEVAVPDDTTVVLDARDTVPVGVETDRPATVVTDGFEDLRTSADGSWVISQGVMGDGQVPMRVTPTEPVTVGAYDVAFPFQLIGPGDSPSYTYDLMFHDDVVPPVPEFRATKRNTATITGRYHALAPDATVGRARFGLAPEHGFATALVLPVPTPAVLTEYVSAGDITWSQDVMVDPTLERAIGMFTSEWTTYRAGQKVTEEWLGQVEPGLLGGVMEQYENAVFVAPNPWIDSDGHFYGRFLGEEEATIVAEVWEDGDLVAELPDAVGEVVVPEGGADYRVVLDARRETDWWKLSTQVRSEWEFHAESLGAEEYAVLPLLDVDLDVARLRLDGSAPRTTRVGVVARHQTGSDASDVERVRLWWSADDGDTWHAARVTGGRGGAYSAVVKAPKGAEHVSLRVEARDEAGSRLTETVIRAYAVD